jgi:hypothetical protein
MNRKIHVRFCSRAAEAIPSLRRHLERSAELRGRAVVDNENEEGKLNQKLIVSARMERIAM